MEKKKTTFFSPTEKWCLPSPTKIKPGERELVAGSDASMHMISRKELYSAELETDDFQVSDDSHNSQWRSADAWRGYSVCQRIGYFLTMKVLEDTPAVLSLGKLCDDHGYSCEWTSGQKPCLIKYGCSDTMQYGKQRSNRGPMVIDDFFFGTTPPTSSPQESTSSTLVPASVECESADEKERWNPSSNPTKIPKPNKNKDHDKKRWNPYFLRIVCNHRYAVVVQDLATQWIQYNPCKTQTSQETERSLQKFLEPIRKPTVIYTDNFLGIG